MRLGIPCETTRPRFKFVGDAVDPVTTRVKAPRRASRRPESANYHRPKAKHSKSSSYKLSQPSSLVVDDRNDAGDLEMPLVNDDVVFNPESVITKPSLQSELQPISPVLPLEKSETSKLRPAEVSILTQDLLAVRSEAASPESVPFYHQSTNSLHSGGGPSLFAADVVRNLPQTVVDGSVEHLVAWFSSFVDMGSRSTSAEPDDGSAMTEIEEGSFPLREKLYLHHWWNSLLKILPVPFAQLENLTGKCSALMPAIIALSACDLAQARTDVRQLTIKKKERWLFSPNTEHQQYGRRYYSLARHELAQLDYSNQEPASFVATLILFTHVESHLGSYRAAAFHHHAIEHLLFARRGFCGHSVLAKDLARIWTSQRAQNWRYRIPFTVPDFQRTLSGLGLDTWQLLDPSEARDEAVIVNMLQSWRLSLMMLFERYAGRGDMESISSRCCRDFYSRIPMSAMRNSWTPKEPILDEDYVTLLAEQRMELDRWYAALSPSHLPRESPGLESSAQDPFKLSEPPLRFLAHQSAMNYICYVTARIFQSSEGLDQFLVLPHLSTHHSGQPDHTRADHWLQILLRIITGLDIAVCARQSFYSVGVLEILHMCHLRLPRSSQMIQSRVDYMIKEYERNCITHEGLHPVLGFRRIFDEIEEQKNLGRDLFYTTPRFSPDCHRQLTYDDAKPYVIYGRDQSTGKLFCQLLQ